MISIIIPVYNVEKYLSKCLESVINQTYKDLQIILIDDGSTDRSGFICDYYAEKDNRIEVIHKNNGGLSSARNAGLDNANGDYISFIDSDDYIGLEMIEKLYKAIIYNNAEISMCSSICIDEKENILKKDKLEDNKLYIGQELIDNFVLPLKTAVWNKMFCKSLIDDTRFPDKRIHGEDLVFFTKLLKNNITMATVSYNGYYYVKHPNSITTKEFSNSRFDEVYCKDISYFTLIKAFPEFNEKAMVWRFRARLNILRALLHDKSNKYEDKKEEYISWITSNYYMIKQYLSFKSKLEYFLLKYFKTFYKYLF